VLGFGKDHARFNACMASYQYYPKITSACKCREAVDACPRGVLEFKARKVQVKDLRACNLCLACVNACKCGKLKVEGREDKFIFNLESWGQYKPKELVKLAVDSLKGRADEFSKLVLK
jgi:NAD-dependent dihydropyrimidine dehydrogenase PreA subunit